MKTTQEQIVKGILRENGEVGRNECLRKNITRLSAIIQDLEEVGWTFTTKRREGDYVYTLLSEPQKKIPQIEFRDGRPVAVYAT